MIASVAQWGDVATWAAAVFTGLAFGVALAVLVMQRREINQLRSEQLSGQARLMLAWPHELELHPNDKEFSILHVH